MAASDTNAIGIDLVTTYCCVAVYRDGKVEIIPNGLGDNTTPSYVCFGETHRLFGSPAQAEAGLSPKNTIFDVKRFIVRRFDDPLFEKDRKMWPFVFRCDANHRPQVEVDNNGKKKLYYPKEISASLLSHLKESAETYLGKNVTDAVITVPAYFNDSQRHATKDAGRIAGLNVLQLLSEPMAAALAYSINMKKAKRPEKVVIVDLGGGTFDVSVIKIEGETAIVKGISGDTHLGGKDFETCLVEYCVKEFETKYPGSKLMSNLRAIHRLYKECEKAKRVLSAANSTAISLNSLWKEHDFNYFISRVCFEEMNGDYLESILPPIEEALRMSEYDKKDIEQIVLVGGSTQIPKIRAIISEYFEGASLNFGVNADEVVAYGAAIQAGDLSNAAFSQMKVIEITPLSSGVDVDLNQFDIFLPRRTRLPARRSRTRRPFHDNQTEADFEIYQGERALASENHKLGTLSFSWLEPKPKDEVRFGVTLAVDKDGILSAEVIREDNKEKKALRVELDKGRLSETDVEQLVEQAEVMRKKDRKEIQRKQALDELETTLVLLASQLKSASLSVPVKKSVNKRLNDTSQWVAVNRFASKHAFQHQKEAIKNCVEFSLRQSTETTSVASSFAKPLYRM